ncbi:MAG: hypothetical protein Q7S01_00715 [bacterium]|nr:hypothetical protein [bacterium]
MNKVVTRKTSSHRAAREISLPQERNALLRRGYGAWRGRSLKTSLKTLAGIRKGWVRKLD